MKLIGNRFKQIRKLLSKSQEQLATELDVTKQAISNIETCKSFPSIQLLYKLCHDYDVNINYLLTGNGEIFVIKEKTYQSLRNTLIQEVENILNVRGIK